MTAKNNETKKDKAPLSREEMGTENVKKAKKAGEIRQKDNIEIFHDKKDNVDGMDNHYT